MNLEVSHFHIWKSSSISTEIWSRTKIRTENQICALLKMASEAVPSSFWDLSFDFDSNSMAVVLESSVWEPNPALYIFIFFACLFSIVSFPYACSSNSGSTAKAPSLFDHGVSPTASSFRFQRNFLVLYSLASGTTTSFRVSVRDLRFLFLF